MTAGPPRKPQHRHPFEVRAILRHLGRLDRPPTSRPARAPPQRKLDFDPTSGFDPAGGEPGPDVEFDQSCPKTSKI